MMSDVCFCPSVSGQTRFYLFVLLAGFRFATVVCVPGYIYTYIYRTCAHVQSPPDKRCINHPLKRGGMENKFAPPASFIRPFCRSRDYESCKYFFFFNYYIRCPYIPPVRKLRRLLTFVVSCSYFSILGRHRCCRLAWLPVLFSADPRVVWLRRAKKEEEEALKTESNVGRSSWEAASLLRHTSQLRS